MTPRSLVSIKSSIAPEPVCCQSAASQGFWLIVTNPGTDTPERFFSKMIADLFCVTSYLNLPANNANLVAKNEMTYFKVVFHEIENQSVLIRAIGVIRGQLLIGERVRGPFH